jgi:hypothetical protein
MAGLVTGTLDGPCSYAITLVAQQHPSAKRKRDIAEDRAAKSARHSSSSRSDRDAGAQRAACWINHWVIAEFTSRSLM